MAKLKVGVIGATGMVGQRFVTLLEEHPFFEVTVLAAGPRSAGKPYREAVEGRWKMAVPLPAYAADMTVLDATADRDSIVQRVDFVFCAVDMKKEEIRALEESYARAEVPVVSNNSAHRFTPDVPMVIPEINGDHLAVIADQRKRLGTRRGFIAVKPNCSLQSYVPALTPLLPFGIREVSVTTFQAISGAGKTFETMPGILDNVIPYIGGEEEKSETEPMKIWGEYRDGVIVPAASPVISASCLRVPVSDGHTAAVSVRFDRKPTREQILSAWERGDGFADLSALPSAPARFVHYLPDCDRPQPRLDRNTEHGMAVSVGRLREDTLFDWKFVGLSHNTLRGAAGGAVLIAELLYLRGYFEG